MIMLVLKCIILFTTSKGIIEIPFAHTIEITSSWKEYTDTCSIKMAKKIRVKGASFDSTPIQEVIKAGDKVEVKLSYDGNYKTEFLGYVNRVHPKAPLEIECQDAMWILKTGTARAKVFQGGSILDVVKHIAPGYTYDVLDSSLGGNFIITSDEPTPLKVLKKIEEVYGLKSTFRIQDGIPVLVVGKQYLNAVNTEVVSYVLNENVIDNNLQFKGADDVMINVRVRSRQTDGKVLRSEFKGDGSGDLKQLSIPGLSQAEVEAAAHRIYDQSKVDRMEGSFTTFGLPVITNGQIAEIDTKQTELTKARYYVDTVVTTFGVDGYRRNIELGAKA